MNRTNNELGIYCTSSNFITATVTISEDLDVVGLPPIVKYDEHDPVPTVVTLVNTVWILLRQRQGLIDGKRGLEQTITSLSQELTYLKKKHEQLESAFNHNENQLIDKKKLLLLKTEDDLEALKKIKSLKQEVHEMNQLLKSREWQFKHDFKRQQIEIASLQSKLRAILSKEQGEKWKGPSDSSIERKSFSRNEDLLKKCICRLENNIQLLVKENLELRRLLDGVSSEMAELLKARQSQVDVT
ncbi:uncharacterized protein LOC128990141 [Macrosteles quadrilineatus]|uniref:uncharacterized protein LOC128990141 n=1 Tax=Macrosteles quadrilineatus TaxID=74068 RepID=UPI0023E1FA9E|nr:uncharacterized protein LOC128990141 [Macrosteles quadrilineatus]